MLDTIRQDVRYAVRSLRRAPGFTTAALLIIALGVGGTTAVFSVVYNVLLRPLPYEEPDRLVTASDFRGTGMTDATYFAWADDGRTIEAIGAYRGRPVLWSAPGEPQRVLSAEVTPSFFRVLRIAPAAGRLFQEADAHATAPPVVLLSYAFWQTRFGGDPAAIGRTVTIDARPYEIVGVAPRALDFPGPDVDVYGVIVMSGALRAVARLAPGATAAQAAAEATAIARRLARSPMELRLMGNDSPIEVRVEPLLGSVTARVRPALLLLAGGIVLVLLIACANVTNLVLSRNTVRSRELAVRAALGAGRLTLIRQLLADSLLLSVAGGVFGVFIGWGLTKAAAALAPENLPRLDGVGVDLRFLAFAFLTAVLVAIVSGALPALRGSAAPGNPLLREGTSRESGSRIRTVLLGTEAALAVTLLVVAVLLGRSFTTLLQVDRGYDPEHVLMGTLYFTGASREAGRRQAALDRVLERVRALPGVRAAGAANTAPFSNITGIDRVTIPGPPDGRPVTVTMASPAVTPGYAEALGMRLRAGRFIQERDLRGGTAPLMVNESFARAFLSDGGPVVGRRYEQLLGFDVAEIVGVVADLAPANLLATGPAPEVQPQIFAPQPAGAFMTLFVRTDGNAAAFAPALRAVVRDVEPEIALDAVAPLATRVANSIGETRFISGVFGAFALFALVLAATGLYGVLSYSVSQRRREMGVRAALGADRAALIRLVMRQGLAVTTSGLLVGLLAAAWITRLLESQLFGISALDATSFAGAALLLLGVAAAACFIPARRAARVNPIEVLRAE